MFLATPQMFHVKGLSLFENVPFRWQLFLENMMIDIWI